MEVEFDPAKDATNRAKHGVSLALAAGMDLAAALVVPDRRHPHGEARFQAIGPVAGRLYLLVFTMRGDTVRAISMRAASRGERKRYAQSGKAPAHLAAGLGRG